MKGGGNNGNFQTSIGLLTSGREGDGFFGEEVINLVPKRWVGKKATYTFGSGRGYKSSRV